MYHEPLDIVPIWLLFVALCTTTGAALEGGYRLGRWRHARTTEEKATPVGAMVGSILGLFAFMLAFTFGMASSRYEARRQAVLDEANAIGTTFLRASLLPEPQRNNSQQLLREYVDVRVDGIRQRRLEEAIRRSEEIHALLWVQVVQAVDSKPGPITALYVQSLNQVIDMHAVRIQDGIRNRIPFTIWIGLYALALLAMSSVGYQSGIAETRRSLAMPGLVLGFASVLILIADLDRPREGFLTVSQEAMTDLQKTMNAKKP